MGWRIPHHPSREDLEPLLGGLLRFLYGTGLRLSEAVGIDLERLLPLSLLAQAGLYARKIPTPRLGMAQDGLAPVHRGEGTPGPRLHRYPQVYAHTSYRRLQEAAERVR
jgi:integrase